MITAASKRAAQEQAARDKVQEDILFYLQEQNVYLERIWNVFSYPLPVTVQERRDYY